MAIEEQLARLKRGVGEWNRWRAENDSVPCDLTRADLHWANLRGANLGGAILHEANLFQANLVEANLGEANLGAARLHEAKLHGANLSMADLSLADLSLVNLNQANLSVTNLSGAQLDGADFSGAKPGLTNFADTDLSTAKGLVSCRHLAPSSIGIDTVVKSGGRISEGFLRDCGVPEPFIVQMKSLVGAMAPIEFYSCFISYSSQDNTFVDRLHADLRAKNLRCWYAPEDLKIGDRFQERIEESIRVHDKVMIILSDASVQSAWVEREVNAAREREDREKRTILFPIRIDDAVMDSGKPWAADLRRLRHIGDFRDWRSHDSYVKAFDRLLRDLKTE